MKTLKFLTPLPLKSNETYFPCIINFYFCRILIIYFGCIIQLFSETQWTQNCNSEHLKIVNRHSPLKTCTSDKENSICRNLSPFKIYDTARTNMERISGRLQSEICRAFNISSRWGSIISSYWLLDTKRYFLPVINAHTHTHTHTHTHIYIYIYIYICLFWIHYLLSHFLNDDINLNESSMQIDEQRKDYINPKGP